MKPQTINQMVLYAFTQWFSHHQLFVVPKTKNPNPKKHAGMNPTFVSKTPVYDPLACCLPLLGTVYITSPMCPLGAGT